MFFLGCLQVDLTICQKPNLIAEALLNLTVMITSPYDGDDPEWGNE